MKILVKHSLSSLILRVYVCKSLSDVEKQMINYTVCNIANYDLCVLTRVSHRGMQSHKLC